MSMTPKQTINLAPIYMGHWLLLLLTNVFEMPIGNFSINQFKIHYKDLYSFV